MALYRNTAEGGTSGTTITAASGSSVDGSVAWNAVTGPPAGGTLAWDSVQPGVFGGLAHKIATGVTAGTAFTEWTTNITYAVPQYLSVCCFVTANPSTQFLLAQIGVGATRQAAVQLTTTGALGLASNAAGNVLTTTATVPLSTWWRVELKLIAASATVGQLELRYFLNPTSGNPSPTETLTSTAAQNTSTGTPTSIRFGLLSSLASVGPFWLDEMQASDSQYPPPPRWRRNPVGLFTRQQPALVRASAF